MVKQFDLKHCIEDRCETDAEIPILSIMEAIFEVLKQVPLRPAARVEHIIHSSKTLMALLSPLIATWHDTMKLFDSVANFLILKS